MGIIISLPVSLLLLWIVLRPKKSEPFPKGGLFRLILAGLICTLIASALSLLISFLMAVIRIGPEKIMQIFALLQTDPYSIPSYLEDISMSHTVSPLWTLFATLITAGLLEELCKYFACRAVIRKKDMIRTWMDSVICFAVVALGFEILENILYAEKGNMISALARNLVPLHFCCGVIMGWYFGKALITGIGKYRWLAVLVPAAIHTLYDTALNLMAAVDDPMEASQIEDIYILLGLAAFAGAFIFAIIVIIKLIRWQKKGKLQVPVV